MTDQDQRKLPVQGDDATFLRGKDHHDKTVQVWMATAAQPQYDWMRQHLWPNK